MPSLVKSNSALASGGIALLEQNVSTRSSTELIVTAKFVALKAYMDTWAARLQPGSVSPVALNYSGNSLSVTGEPKLNSVQASVQAGLVYFDCQFSAQRAITDGSDSITNAIISSSSSIQLQSFSGSWTYSVGRRSIVTGEEESEEDTYTSTLEFDCYAESRTLTSSSPQIFAIGRAQLTLNSLFLGQPFNIRGSALDNIVINSNDAGSYFIVSQEAYASGLLVVLGFKRSLVIPQVIYSSSIDKSESGSYKYSLNASVRLLQGNAFTAGGLTTSELVFPNL